MVYRNQSRGRSYTKTYRGRNARRGTTPWYNRKYSTMQLAGKALAGVKYLKGLVNSELYKHDIATTSVTVNNTTGQVINLTQIPQNDTDSGRTGNSVLAKSLNLKLDFVKNASSTVTFMRIMIVMDTQQIADTSPALSDILDAASTLSPLNNATVGRFKVLKNIQLNLHDNKPCATISCYHQLQHHIRFNGTSQFDLQKGGIYLVALSDQGTNLPSMFYNSRLSYHDN